VGSKKNRRRSGQAGSIATEIRSVNKGTEYSGDSANHSRGTSFWSTNYFEWLALAIASVISYWFLTARLVGVNVSVLVDEYSYVVDTLFRTPAEAKYPNQLFQIVYSTTKACGTEFYSCARSISALFVIAGGLIIYALAKNLSRKKWLASIAAASAVLGSYGTYTAYFMPETIFNFFMVAFFWAIIRFGNSTNPFVWSGFGLLLGLASLAKIHVLFALPGILLFVLLQTIGTRKKFVLQATVRLAALGGTLFASKFVLGEIIAGEAGRSVFGGYGSTEGVADAVTTQVPWFNVIGTAWGQTLMLVMILGFALVVSLMGLSRLFTREPKQSAANAFRGLFALVLLNMAAVSAVFEAWQNLDTWMHTRYYSYLIPLGIVVLVEAYSRPAEEKPTWLRRSLVALFVILSSIALVTAAIPYGANWIDAPDFRTHIDLPILSSALLLAGIGLAIWWLWDSRTTLLIGILVASLASISAGTYISTFLSQTFGGDSVHDQLGRLLHNYLPQDELDRALLVGDDGVSLQRALFSSLSGEAKYLTLSGGELEISELDSNISWLVVVGEPKISSLPSPDLTANGYSLYSIDPGNAFAPRNAGGFTFSGMCESPDSADWACGAETVLTFPENLPANASIDLIVEVSEAASQNPLSLKVGNSVIEAQFPSGLTAVTLNFSNSSPLDNVVISRQEADGVALPAQDRLLRPVSLVRSPR